MNRTTDIKIDTETGLPELPEGQYWRVHEKQPFWYDTDREFIVGAYCDVDRVEWSDWSRTKPALDEYDRLETRARRVGRDGLLRRSDMVTEYRVKTVETEPRLASRGSLESLGSEPPSERDIYFAAMEIARRMVAERNAVALIGCYPPNKIGKK